MVGWRQISLCRNKKKCRGGCMDTNVYFKGQLRNTNFKKNIRLITCTNVLFDCIFTTQLLTKFDKKNGYTIRCFSICDSLQICSCAIIQEFLCFEHKDVDWCGYITLATTSRNDGFYLFIQKLKAVILAELGEMISACNLMSNVLLEEKKLLHVSSDDGNILKLDFIDTMLKTAYYASRIYDHELAFRLARQVYISVTEKCENLSSCWKTDCLLIACLICVDSSEHTEQKYSAHEYLAYINNNFGGNEIQTAKKKYSPFLNVIFKSANKYCKNIQKYVADRRYYQKRSQYKQRMIGISTYDALGCSLKTLEY